MDLYGDMKNNEQYNLENNLHLQNVEQDKTKKEWGGHNSETILMTINTFKNILYHFYNLDYYSKSKISLS